MLIVTTYFWKDPDRAKVRTHREFNHDDVRRLRSMVGRHLSHPHRFVVVSDEDIDGVERVPLDWSKHVPSTCFIRLMQRRSDYATHLRQNIMGLPDGPLRIFNLDLDLVVVGDLGSLVDRHEPSVWWHNPNWPAPRRARYQTSVQLFTTGHHYELYERFDPKARRLPTGEDINHRFGGAEQAWVSEMLPWDEPFWDERDGIYGAGRVGDWSSDRVVDLPDNARIVSFPGNRLPDDPEVIKKFPWIKEYYTCL